MGMIADLVNRGRIQTSQVGTRKVLFTITVLLTCIVTLGIVAQRSLSEESPACDQYGCAADAIHIQTSLAEITGVPHSASASARAATGASASASVTASAVAAETSGVTGPDTLTTADPVASAPDSASASTSSEKETPADGSTPVAAVPHDGGDGIEESDDPGVTEQPPSGEPISSKPLIDGYPYDGKPCKDSYCGIEGVNGPVKCVSYETALGEEVYGCADPRTYEDKGCYKLTFYTPEGKPYSNLDTCSGESPYAPPKPPKGDFSYWDSSTDWSRWTPEHGFRVCQQGWHCGLEGIPKHYECSAYFDTVHGAVRGCYDRRRDCGPLHVYDEAGREIGIYEHYADCEVYQRVRCGEDQCGLQRIPDRMECDAYYIRYGPLYRNYSEIAYRCHDDELMRKYYRGELEKPYRKTCLFWIDPSGQRNRGDCIPDGGGEIAEEAGNEANDTEDTLHQGRRGSMIGELDSETSLAASSGPFASGAEPRDPGPLLKTDNPLLRAIFGLLGGEGSMASRPSYLEVEAEPRSLISAEDTVSVLPLTEPEAASPSTGKKKRYADTDPYAPPSVPLLPSAAPARSVRLSARTGSINGGNGSSASRRITPIETEQREPRGTVKYNQASVPGTPPKNDHSHALKADEYGSFESSKRNGGLDKSAADLQSTVLGRAQEPAVVEIILPTGWVVAMAPLIGLGIFGGAFILHKRLMG